MNEEYTSAEIQEFLELLKQERFFSSDEIVRGRCTQNALMRAVERTAHSTTLRLLACGLDPRRADKQGRTPVEVARLSASKELQRTMNLAIQLWEKGILTDRGITEVDDEDK